VRKAARSLRLGDAEKTRLDQHCIADPVKGDKSIIIGLKGFYGKNVENRDTNQTCAIDA
jgi:hypothetical protein